MNRDDIIALAKRKAALKAYRRNPGMDFYEFTEEYLLDFVALVAAAEREACAKVCEDLDTVVQDGSDSDWTVTRSGAFEDAADAIRKRGEA